MQRITEGTDEVAHTGRTLVVGRRGKGRDIFEAIVTTTFNRQYRARKADSSVDSIAEEVLRRCAAANVKVPQDERVRSRIGAMATRVKLERRHARPTDVYDRFAARRNGATDSWPYSTIHVAYRQIETTSTLRPWLLIAVDEFSRMVVGLHVSMSTPTGFDIGSCLVQTMLPKEEWLLARWLAGEWPCWGFPLEIHIHAESEVDGESALRRACEVHGIQLTVTRAAKKIDGVAGIAPKAKATPAQDVVVMLTSVARGTALDDQRLLEHIFATVLLEVYHETPSEPHGVPPMRRFKDGVLGDCDARLGVGLPEPIFDEERLRLYFAPESDVVTPFMRGPQHSGAALSV